MDIRGSSIMVLGGPGLVGMAVCRRFLLQQPKKLVITALGRAEVEPAVQELRREVERLGGNTEVSGRWGNIFVRSEFKDLSRKELFGDAARRDRFLLDTIEPYSPEIGQASYLYQLVGEERPEIIIDCINTATALAYQDVFEESRQTYSMLKELSQGGASASERETFETRVQMLIGTQYTPQLIRHIQILWNSLTEFGVKTYLKIGTSGTGGMGFNIPYTHSEDKPSRVLMAKSAIAGAHTMMLFLLGRTAREMHEKSKTSVWSPDRNIKPAAPIIKEIKPATAIAWKGIIYGEIRQKGRPVEIYDLDPRQALEASEILKPKTQPWKKVGNETLKAPYIDTGENGIFSRGEFEAITDEGQMEFITPEEIAESVEQEIMGGNSGSDVVSAMDSVVLGPTYRAGFLRQRALEKLRQLETDHKTPSVAFENLGPPRLSKLLYELHLIVRERGLLDDKGLSAAELSVRCEKTILTDEKLRAQILSLGLAIVLRDGKILRASNLIIPSKWDFPGDGRVTPAHIDKFAHQGWVDLREKNLKTWVDRLAILKDEATRADNENTGSVYVRNRTFWETVAKEGALGSVISWIFLREENGERVKR